MDIFRVRVSSGSKSSVHYCRLCLRRWSCKKYLPRKSIPNFRYQRKYCFCRHGLLNSNPPGCCPYIIHDHSHSRFLWYVLHEGPCYEVHSYWKKMADKRLSAESWSFSVHRPAAVGPESSKFTVSKGIEDCAGVSSACRCRSGGVEVLESFIVVVWKTLKFWFHYRRVGALLHVLFTVTCSFTEATLLHAHTESTAFRFNGMGAKGNG